MSPATADRYGEPNRARLASALIAAMVAALSVDPLQLPRSQERLELEGTKSPPIDGGCSPGEKASR